MSDPKSLLSLPAPFQPFLPTLALLKAWAAPARLGWAAGIAYPAASPGWFALEKANLPWLRGWLGPGGWLGPPQGQEGSGGSTPVPALRQPVPAHPELALVSGFGSLALLQKRCCVIKERRKALSSTPIHCSGVISCLRQLLSCTHLPRVR